MLCVSWGGEVVSRALSPLVLYSSQNDTIFLALTAVL